VTVRVITADSVVRKEITVSKASETFRVPLPAEPISFRFDEGGWLLGTVHTDQTPTELADMARHDLDTAARNWALRALAGSADSAAVDARRFVVLNEHEPQLRAEALRQMAGDSTPSGLSVARSALRDPDGSVRAQALRTVAALAPDGIAETALAMYRTDPDAGVRGAALQVYAGAAGAAAMPVLLDAVGPTHPTRIRLRAADALARLHDPRAADALARMTDPQEERIVRQFGLRGLAASGDTARTVEVAGRALDDQDPLFAVAAARTLGALDSPAARTELRSALGSETRESVKDAIERALSGD
jgi:hypothetical protein